MPFVALSLNVKPSNPVPYKKDTNCLREALLSHKFGVENNGTRNAEFEALLRMEQITIALIPDYNQLKVRLTFLGDKSLEYLNNVLDILLTKPCFQIDHSEWQIESVALNNDPWAGIAT